MCYKIDITSDSPGRVFPSQSCTPSHDYLLVKEYLINTGGQVGNAGIWFNNCGYRLMGHEEEGEPPLLFYSQVASPLGYRQGYSSTLEEAITKYDRIKKMEWMANGFFISSQQKSNA